MSDPEKTKSDPWLQLNKELVELGPRHVRRSKKWEGKPWAAMSPKERRELAGMAAEYDRDKKVLRRRADRLDVRCPPVGSGRPFIGALSWESERRHENKTPHLPDDLDEAFRLVLRAASVAGGLAALATDPHHELDKDRAEHLGRIRNTLSDSLAKARPALVKVRDASLYRRERVASHVEALAFANRVLDACGCSAAEMLLPIERQWRRMAARLSWLEDIDGAAVADRMMEEAVAIVDTGGSAGKAATGRGAPVLDSAEKDILRAMADAKCALTQADIAAFNDPDDYPNIPVSRTTLGKRLSRLRGINLIYRPGNDRGGDALTELGWEYVRSLHS